MLLDSGKYNIYDDHPEYSGVAYWFHFSEDGATPYGGTVVEITPQAAILHMQFWDFKKAYKDNFYKECESVVLPLLEKYAFDHLYFVTPKKKWVSFFFGDKAEFVKTIPEGNIYRFAWRV